MSAWLFPFVMTTTTISFYCEARELAFPTWAIIHHFGAKTAKIEHIVLNRNHLVSCIFLDYMLQLIGVQRSRGASGGQQISSLLNGGEVSTQSK